MTSVGIMASAVVTGVAPGLKSALGSASSITSGSTLVITTTNPIAVDDLVVVRVASDNLTATTPTFTATDSAGNTYTTRIQKAQQAIAANGIAAGIIVSKVTNPVAAGGTITVTLSGAVACRAAYAESFVGFENTTRATISAAANSSVASTSGVLVGVLAGDLVIGAVGIETNAVVTGDADTTGGAWSAIARTVADTSIATTSATVSGQSKVANATADQTHNTTWTGSTDYAGCAVALIPT